VPQGKGLRPVSDHLVSRGVNRLTLSGVENDACRHYLVRLSDGQGPIDIADENHDREDDRLLECHGGSGSGRTGRKEVVMTNKREGPACEEDDGPGEEQLSGVNADEVQRCPSEDANECHEQTTRG
jgi:hypothetical protein